VRRSRALAIVLSFAFGASPSFGGSEEAIERNRAGTERLQEGKVAEAVAEFEKAVRLDPGYAPAKANLGYAYDTQGRIQEAVTAYEAALETDPKNARVRNNLGVLYGKQGRHDEAVAALEAARAIDPGDATGDNLQMARRNRDAAQKIAQEIAHARKEAEAQPESPMAAYKAARLYAFHGKKDEALEWLARALKLGFNDYGLLKADPALSRLQEDWRFTRLLTAR
jgi:tetratricopeptide (TPR) repeat protein